MGAGELIFLAIVEERHGHSLARMRRLSSREPHDDPLIAFCSREIGSAFMLGRNIAPGDCVLLSSEELDDEEIADLKTHKILLFRNLQELHRYIEAPAEVAETLPIVELETANACAQAQGKGSGPIVRSEDAL